MTTGPCDASIVVHNKNQVIATLTNDNEFNLELDIRKGRGFVTSLENTPEEQIIGAIPIDFSKGDPVQQIHNMRSGDGVDKGIDAVGYQAIEPGKTNEAPSIVLDALIQVVNPTGILGIPGLYVPSDPGGVDPHAREGRLLIPFGKLFEKGLRLGTGQCNVKRYNRYLRDLIIAGRAKPSFIVSHDTPLNDAPMAYDKFDKRVEGYTKVILKP